MRGWFNNRSGTLTNSLLDYSFQKRANINDENEKIHQLDSKGRSRSRLSDSYATIHKLKKDGHRVRGTLDIGLPSDKSANEQLPQIKINHGHMSCHIVSWLTGSPDITENKVRFQLQKGKEVYYRKPKKDIKLYTTKPYKIGYIETRDKHADVHTLQDVEDLLKHDQKLFKVTTSNVLHDRNSEHTLPALHITPGQKKIRISSAFFHREGSLVLSPIVKNEVKLTTPHAGDKRKREGDLTYDAEKEMKLEKRSVSTTIETVSIWKRGDPKNNKGKGKSLNSNLDERKTMENIAKSTKDLEKLMQKGHEIKAISNIAIHADKSVKEPSPIVSIRNGKKSGHVVSWILQHPHESSTQSSSGSHRPSFPHHGPDIHTSGFVKVGKGLINDPYDHQLHKVVHTLIKDGFHVKGANLIRAISDPNSSNKYPSLLVKPGNQHARVLSTYTRPQKPSKSICKDCQQTHGPNTHQARNLIDTIDKPSSSQRVSLSSSSSSSDDTRFVMHRRKKPRTD